MDCARSRRLAALASITMVAAGCGSGGHAARTRASAPTVAAKPADSSAVTVIRAWSTALRRGDVAGAARYFALPSEFANGALVAIRTEAEARAVNATLPCGALLLSVAQRGRFVSALFRLTNRPGPGAGCGSGAGQLARTNFIIVGGRILAWIRAPEIPGGSPTPVPPPTPAPAPTAPSSGPVI